MKASESDNQRDVFSMTYQTGSDIWTHLPLINDLTNFLPEDIDKGSLVLDLGSGRGNWCFELLERGYRCVGIDYVKHLVDEGNKKIKERGLINRGRFMESSVMLLPFQKESFDMVSGILTSSFLSDEEYVLSLEEVSRVLKSGGYYLEVSLSSHTQNFLGFRPSASDESYFERFGLRYCFRNQNDFQDNFFKKFFLVKEDERSYQPNTDPGDDLVLRFSLYKKGSD